MKIEYSTKFNISPNTKATIISIVMGVFLAGFLILNFVWTNANITHYDNVQKAVKSFKSSCVSEHKLDKEKFNDLCKIAKENDYVIKIGLNSENLTIDETNLLEDRPLLGNDRIVIGGIGSGGFVLERLDFGYLNREPQVHRDKFGHYYID